MRATVSARIAAILAGVAFATPAAAHLGHVGEAAGHSHWIALAALAGAAALAAWIAKSQGDEAEEADEDAEAEAEGDAEEARA